MYPIDYFAPYLAALIAIALIIYFGASFLASIRYRSYDRSESAEKLRALGRAVDRVNENG